MTEHTTLLGEKPKWWQWALLGLTILLALFLLWQVRDGFVLLWKQNTSALQFRFSLDYGEGPLLDQAVRLSRFENIYRRNIQEPPYTISNYPPIYPLLQVPFVWIFGPKLWYGRLISHLSILLTSIFIGLIIWKLSRNWIAAGMSGLSFLLVPYVFFWSTFARVDSLALMFSVAAMLVVVSAPDRRRNLIWGAVLLVAAIYTKQSYGFTAPFALFIFLLRDRPRKKAFELAGWSVLFGAVLFGLMQLVSKGGFFFHVFLANVNPFHWQMVRDYRDEIMEYFPFLIFFGFAYLVGGCWKRIRQPIWWLVAPYLLAASLVSITIGKEGSSVNYLYEFSTALALLIGALLSLGKGKQQWL
ncbi:MAG: glycosyltransferase family 39 protein, partial [Anaerolineaceae bacterium]|nr:glycosyltransferase family 39 protein [Anaerolineaceae bacterium]